MSLTLNEIRKKAIEFSEEWQEESREKAEAQTIWNEFLDIFGITRRRIASFGEPVKKLGERGGVIDLFWKLSVVLLVTLFASPIASADDVEKYIQNLKDENYTIRANAAYSLGEFNDTRAVDPLIDALNDRISDVRNAAASSLGEINDTSVVDPLIQMLRRETNDESIGTIAVALGKIGDPRAVDPLIQELDEGNWGCDWYLRYSDKPVFWGGSEGGSRVTWALGEIGDPRAVDSLSNSLSTSISRSLISLSDGKKPNFGCCVPQPYAVATALEKIAKRGGNSQANDALIKALSTVPEWYVDQRVFIVSALGNVGDPRSVDVLIKIHENENDDYAVREAAGDALKNLPTL